MDIYPQRILSLCSGVGMLDIGVEEGLRHIGIDSRVVGFCERESYAAATLLARMEDSALEPAPISDDFNDFDERWRGCVDWIVAGFPCQPWSVAGNQAGKDDERWIWDDILRIIDVTEAPYIFLENVPGLASGEAERGTLVDGSEVAVRGDGLDTVLRSLAERGFDAEWCHLQAKEVGASHRRERVLVLAYQSGRGLSRRDGQSGNAAGCGEVPGHAQRPESRSRNEGVKSEPSGSGGDRLTGAGDGLDDTTGPRYEQAQQGANVRDSEQRGGECVPSDGRRRLGDAGSTRENTHTEGSGSRDSIGESGGRLGDASSQRLQGGSNGRSTDTQGREVENGYRGQPGDSLFAPGRDRELWNRIIETHPHLAPAIEPGVRLLADGNALVLDASRADQLRCVGNSVVAIQASVALVVLAERAVITEFKE